MTTAVTVTSVPIINSATHRQVYATVSVPTTPTEPSDVIIYDPTAATYTNTGAYVATKIRGAKVASSCQGLSGTGANISLVWDASSPVVALSIPSNNSFSYESSVGNCLWQPLPNQGGSGVTGKIGLTASGLVAGDSITIILDIING